jgi:hypothetical protein
MALDAVTVLRRSMFPGRGWVLFEHGTYVVSTRALFDMKAAALQILREWGPVRVGSPAGDFAVIKLRNVPGWVIACHHPDVLTYVAPDELPPDPPDLHVGLFGRNKRDRDARELTVIHEESWKDAIPG